MSEPSDIQLVGPDAGWGRAFELESDRIRGLLGPLAQGLEHIGSTAVPGLAAKPIVDMMVGVGTEADVQPSVGLLVELGYQRWPAGDFPGRTFLRRVDDAGRVTHHVSVTVRGGGYWADQLTFRDALRRDPGLVRRYAELKRELVGHGVDVSEYTRAKTTFVREVLLAAGHTPQTGWASEGLGARMSR